MYTIIGYFLFGSKFGGLISIAESGTPSVFLNRTSSEVPHNNSVFCGFASLTLLSSLKLGEVTSRSGNSLKVDAVSRYTSASLAFEGGLKFLAAIINRS